MNVLKKKLLGCSAIVFILIIAVLFLFFFNSYADAADNVVKYELQGTIKCMSAQDRCQEILTDSSKTTLFKDVKNKYTDAKKLMEGEGIKNDFSVAILELDCPMEISCYGHGAPAGQQYTKTVSAVCLARSGGYYHDTDEYNKLSEFNNKHVTCIVNLEYFPSQGCDGVMGDVFSKNVISVTSDSSSKEDKYNKDGEIMFNKSWLQKDTNIFNNSLAEFCANCSEKIEDDDESVSNYLSESGFYDFYASGDKKILGKSSAYSISHKVENINGKEFVVLLIDCRGSQHMSELIGDLDHGNDIDFLQTKIYENVNDFVNTVFDGLYNYGNTHYVSTDKPVLLNSLPNNSLKVIVTGHSLGGAAANAISAKLDYEAGYNSWWLNRLSKTDIYSYTYGAIKVLGDIYEDNDINIEEGYENIHNVYNWSDSYGPYGSKQYTHVSSPFRKFGHTETFDIDKHDSFWPWVVPSHEMRTYMEAIESNKSDKFITLGCKTKDRIDINSIPSKQELLSFLTYLQEFTGSNDDNGLVKYDCNNPLNSSTTNNKRFSKSILQAIIDMYPCVDYNIYPVEKQITYVTKSSPDPTGKFSQMNYYKYCSTSKNSVEWISKNIFNINDNLHEDLNMTLTQNDLSNYGYSYYYNNGNYYAGVINGRGENFLTPNILSATYDGEYYYIEYKYVGTNNYVKANLKPIYAKLQLKEIDGKKYWSVCSINDK